MKNWIWWWRQNWNDATILPLWSTKLPSVAPWQGRLKSVFSGKQLGLVQEETLVVFYTRGMPRKTARTTWNEVEMRKKFSPWASILFSTESEETDWRKSLNSPKASLATKAIKSIAYCEQDEKYRRVIIDIIPCVVVTCLETDAFIAIVACVDKLMVRATSARGREEGTQGAVAALKKKKKKRPRLCNTKFRSNEYHSVESWRIYRHHPVCRGGAVAALKKKKKNVQGCVTQNSDPMWKVEELGMFMISIITRWNASDSIAL